MWRAELETQQGATLSAGPSVTARTARLGHGPASQLLMLLVWGLL